jgi:hypothetical protein
VLRRSRRWLLCLAAPCALSALGVLGAPRDAAAADATSLACIRLAEDGQDARDHGKLLRAREQFAACSARECPAVLRRDCARWTEEAKQATPSVVVIARDASGRDVVDARASIDGQLRQSRLDGTLIEIDPGAHVVRVDMANRPPVEVRVVFGSGEKNRTIVLTLASAPEAPKAPGSATAHATTAPTPPDTPAPARGLPAATYVFGAVGLVALGSFGYFALRGKSDADHLRSTCVPGCETSDVSAVHTKLLAADVSLGIGIASLGAAAFFALTRGRSGPTGPASASASTWEVRAAPRGMTGGTGELVVRF